MTLFTYKAINEGGDEVEGSIDAINRDVAISAVQRRGLIISSMGSSEDNVPLLQKSIASFDRVSTKDIVILSRQISTLFEAQVSALKVFGLLAAESENPLLKRSLAEVVDDLRGGSSISKALSKHPKVFSQFYVNMVSVGEETGKLEEIFLSLADYLDRTYEVGAKVRNALIYPAFVIVTFLGVMVLMLTTVIPRISGVLIESAQEIPVYTQIVLSISNFLVRYGFFFLIVIVIGTFFGWRYVRTSKGIRAIDQFKIELPYVGSLYKKLYLSRISDNMNTMLTAGISMVRAIETTASIVGNIVYEDILIEASEAVKGGASFSSTLANSEEIPGIMTQMIRIGEETGEVGSILSTLGRFYRREVSNAVDTLVDLIEPAMVVLLGAGVGLLLASVLIPIYNIASSI